jgi:hypothetical protein
MTTRHTEPIVCECGYKGAVIWRENDAPFSRQYEDYSLSGFKGEGFSCLFTTLSDAIDRMKPTCPECGAVGKVTFL